jgi:hypothetical protein
MQLVHKLFLMAALLTSSHAFAQITADPEDRARSEQGKDPLRTQTPEGRPLPFGQRLRFGGGISGLRFGNPTILGASPVVAYQAAERLILGVGFSYTYIRYKAVDRTTGRTIPFETYNQIGGRGFVMYEAVPSIVPNLYLHGEIETTTIQLKNNITNVSSSLGSITAPLVGITYSQRIGRLASFNLTALYNLNYTNSQLSQSIYGSPLVLRVAFF